jgi:hypothetical protein
MYYHIASHAIISTPTIKYAHEHSLEKEAFMRIFKSREVMHERKHTFWRFTQLLEIFSEVMQPNTK